MASTRRLFCVYLAMLFLMGLGYISILPVFEGIDETAHYSSAQQIADTGTFPTYGASFISQSVIDYYRHGGTSRYGAVPAYVEKNTPAYTVFFAKPDAVKAYAEAYGQPQPYRSFRPSTIPNWQSQHPPLYYLTLVPVMKMTRNLSLIAQMFVLRLFSFLLALGGVALGLIAARRASAGVEDAAVWNGFFLYPLALPMFFPEFARLGNDSLCLLLAGSTAYLLSLKSVPRWLLGIVLGLGFLTKALFAPISGAIAIVWFFEFWKERKDVQKWKWHCCRAITVFLPALLVGGSWYAYTWIVSGHFPSGSDALLLSQHGGLIPNLKEKFSFMGFAGGLVATIKSWSWAGISESLTSLLGLWGMPVLLLDLWIMFAFLQHSRDHAPTNETRMISWLLILFGCGLFYHVLICVALSGYGNTPGWYLHVLMPWIAPVLGLGIIAIQRTPRLTWVWRSLLIYAALFQLAAIWAETSLFTGCAIEGADKSYRFSGNYLCLDQAGGLLHRLAINGWPHLALVGFGGGLACAFWLMLISARQAKS